MQVLAEEKQQVPKDLRTCATDRFNKIFNTDSKTFKSRSISLYNFIEYFVEAFILGIPFG